MAGEGWEAGSRHCSLPSFGSTDGASTCEVPGPWQGFADSMLQDYKAGQSPHLPGSKVVGRG